MIELRPHQEDAVEQIRQSLRKGNKRPLLAAPCSMGKTIISSFIMMRAAENGVRSIFFCDRVKLVGQTVETFERLGADFSVMQGDDPRYDPNKMIQIASIQTAVRRKHLNFGLAIVDECHTMYKGLVDGFMTRYDNVPFIGLSATPYSKGLGKYWDDLLVPITPRQLIDLNYLCPTDYYVGETISTKGIKKKALPTGGSDFDAESLGAAMIDSETFNGDVVENYRVHSADLTKRAIAFSPSVAHSKALVEKFNAAGIPALHIDGYMPEEERKYIYSDHRSGKALVLSCSRLLGTGYDDPSVEILIDCFPTSKNSKISWIQRAGRIWRIAPGKERAIYLDHAGNLHRHGMFPEDVIPDSLHSGDKKFDERDQTKKEEKEPIMRDCPVCSATFTGRKCACGYELAMTEPVFKDTGGMLKKVDKLTLSQDKNRWYGELLYHSRSRGWSDGWAAHAYKSKFDVWPRNVDKIPVKTESKDVKNWIQMLTIRRAKGNAKYLNSSRAIG